MGNPLRRERTIQGVDWTTNTGSVYTLDGEVRTEHTHDPYALPEEKTFQI